MLRKTIQTEYDKFERITKTTKTVKLFGILLYTLILEENRTEVNNQL